MKKSRFEGSPGLHRPAHPPLCLSACLPPPPHSFPISPFLSFTVSLISNSYNVSLICVWLTLHLFLCNPSLYIFPNFPFLYISFSLCLFHSTYFFISFSLFLFLSVSFFAPLSHNTYLFMYFTVLYII